VDRQGALLQEFVLSVLMLTACVSVPALAESRIALVIGNSAYQHVAPLDNPNNDARLMADTLRELGFALVGDGAQLDLDKAGLGQQNPGFGERRRHRHAHHLDDL